MSNSYPGGLLTAGADTSYSVAFDGSGDYLQLNSPINFGSNNFTVEGWFFLRTLSGTFGLWGASNGGGGVPKLQDFISSSNYTLDLNGSSVISFTASSYFREGQWNHLAICRGGTGSNQTAVFVNGVRAAVGTVGSQTGITSNFNIGSNESGVITAGSYISNFRVVNGTDVYGYTNTSITIPTQLLNIPNTILLTCQDIIITDKSNSPYTITVNGDCKVSNFTPFAGYKGFNPALGSAAGGVWTLEQATSYQNNRTWPIYDPYFNYNTLLLRGNGSNTATNSTFIDASTNNFTITRNGNTTQGSVSPFAPAGWGVYNTGSSYCTLNNADYSLGTGDFTVEFWMFCVDDSTYSASTFCTATSNPNFTVSMGGNSSGARQPYLEYGGSGAYFGTLYGYLNKWTHIAFVRRSGNISVYQNGVLVGSGTKAGSVGTTSNLVLLRNTGDGSADFRGHISNFRITKAAVYTSNFTPSTTPLNVITNTVLLTFQSNRFVDNGPFNSTVTPTGSTAIQSFSPFVPQYITPTTYSYKFDGTGDYISTGDASTACAFPAGTDFTIECWFNNVATVSDGTIWSTSSSISASEQLRLDGGANNNTLRVISTYTTKITASATYSNSTWNHVAVVRSGTTLTLYLNGVNIGSASNNQSFTADNFTIGSCGGAGGPFPFNGIISNLRVVKGTALYTTNFTPPSAPLAAISGTQLLTCKDSTFIDNSSNNFTITASGDAKPLSSPTPFPPIVDQTTINSTYIPALDGGSAFFDGTGDYLTLPANSAFNFNSGDFTLETWVYMPSVSSAQEIFSQGSGDFQGIGIYVTSGAKVQLDLGNGSSWFASYTTSDSVVRNNWTHVAIVRQSTTYRIFLNGIASSTNTNATFPSNASGASSYIGIFGPASSQLFTGYMCGFRIIKGTALYTSAFAPPIAPPTPVANTQLLLNFTNAAIYDQTGSENFEAVSNDPPKISTLQSKWGGSSIAFNSANTGSSIPYLLANRHTDKHAFYTGDFTVEAWVYILANNDLSSDIPILNYGNGGANGPLGTASTWVLIVQNAGAGLKFYRNTDASTEVSVSWTGTVPYNQWAHIAVARGGTGLRAFVNGIQIGSTNSSTTSYAPVSGNNRFFVGGQSGGGGNNNYYKFPGYLQDARVTKGIARYVSNFTPPTSGFQFQ